MFKILKSEIQYFNWLMLLMVILPICFTLFAMNDILLFTKVYFLKKYFWSVLVGMGIYGLMFMIWSLRKKELRERIHYLIPVKLNNLSFVRWLLGVSPFVLIGLYIELHHGFLSSEQEIFIDRINGQLGMMFIAVAGFDFAINTWISFEVKRYDKRLLFTIGVIVLLFVLSFGVIYAVTTSLIKPFGFGGEEIIFFLWGLLISIASGIIFTKRKSFLG